MGQKTHPVGFRLGYIKTWDSRWFAKRDYAAKLHQDLAIRNYIKKNFANAAISRVHIERTTDRIVVHIWTARPGMIIGTKGARISQLREELKELVAGELDVEIREIENAELDAQLVAENIAAQLERRMGFRRVMKKTLATVMKLGVKGCKIQVKGRIGGAEMARLERYADGRVPLQTLRADIDYGQAEGKTVYGLVGVKVWIFRDEVLPSEVAEREASVERARRPAKKKRRRPKRSGSR
ncbi:MAG: 30S ribosomal protein S3 [candidate division Zixibacteria bacterium]|nr:30S ribosomal protein S3 [candidate division Zixibacteria bacterium]